MKNNVVESSWEEGGGRGYIDGSADMLNSIILVIPKSAVKHNTI